MVEVIRFDPGPTGRFLADSQVARYRQEGMWAAGGTCYETMVSAGSRAVVALSREIAEAVRAVR